jgi:hypothetical protein
MLRGTHIVKGRLLLMAAFVALFVCLPVLASYSHGNSREHKVKLVASNGTDVPGAWTTVRTAGAAAGQFA